MSIFKESNYKESLNNILGDLQILFTNVTKVNDTKKIYNMKRTTKPNQFKHLIEFNNNLKFN